MQLLLAKNHLYARTAAASSGTWFSFPLSTPALFGLALELTKPDINLISGFTSETVSTSGYSTTRVFYRRDVPTFEPLWRFDDDERTGFVALEYHCRQPR